MIDVINKTGAIVSFSIPPELKNKILIPNYESESDLHITLIKIIHIDDNVLNIIYNSLYKIGSPPNIGTIKEIKRFNNVQNSNNDAIVLLLDFIDLYLWRNDLIQLLEIENISIVKNKFNPHITLAYIDSNIKFNIPDYLYNVINNQYIFNNLELRTNGRLYQIE